jgi:uncharacterized membrane protein YhaH (DUF805 family)
MLNPWKVKVPMLIIVLLLIVVIWMFFQIRLNYIALIILGLGLNYVSDAVVKAVNRGGKFSQLFSFKGRIGRYMYWAIYVALILVNIIFILPISIYVEEGRAGAVILALVGLVISIFCCWIAAATSVKRWHDTGKSGWLSLTLLIPIVNIVILLYLGTVSGTNGANTYGNAPGRLESA